MSRIALLAISDAMVEWEPYAIQLNISQAKQTEIKKDHHRYSEQKYQFLLLWKQQKGRAATWRALFSACFDLNDDHLKEKVIELCK